MHFQSFTILSLGALAVAAPTLKVRQSGPVLADTTYNAISISGGVAGKAESEALAVFSALDVANPGNIDAADIKFLGAVNDVANQAEEESFNPAVAAATGDAADQIQNGKIKNKVLKLTASKIQLSAQLAQGKDVAAKLAEETTKLNNNIATDVKNAGQTSIAESLDATISGGGAVAAGAGAKTDTAKATGGATAATNGTAVAGAKAGKKGKAKAAKPVTVRDDADDDTEEDIEDDFDDEEVDDEAE